MPLLAPVMTATRSVATSSMTLDCVSSSAVDLSLVVVCVALA
jgi:hypothetical protein